MQAPIDDFKRPGQNVALLQFAHADLDCVSQNGRAAFRLLGLFDTSDDAVTWFRRNDQRRFYDGLPATVIPSFEDVVVPRSKTRTVEELAANATPWCVRTKTHEHSRRKRSRPGSQPSRTAPPSPCVTQKALPTARRSQPAAVCGGPFRPVRTA